MPSVRSGPTIALPWLSTLLTTISAEFIGACDTPRQWLRISPPAFGRLKIYFWRRLRCNSDRMSSPLKPVKYRFNSLGDFLIANPLSVNGELDDGWGGRFPVKGREIKASILFCDISGFSKRTLRL